MKATIYSRSVLRIFAGLLVAIFFLNHATLQKDPIDYPGQKPPGMQAELFAPGLVSSGLSEHSAPAFSPDGSVVLWTVMDKNYRGYLLEMVYSNGAWSRPARPSFADSTADDYYPSFSPDGKKLFFSSRRKLPEGFSLETGIRIWEVEKKPGGWGNPVPFDTTVSKGEDYAHSIASNGTFYFSSGEGSDLNIRKAEKGSSGYATPVLLPFSINSVGYEDGPYIAPDESFLIFESQRPEGINGSLDLYIAFKNKKGEWTLPVNMGPAINSASAERFAGLSPDGKYLFFGSGRNMSPGNWGFDIFWIDAKVIAELRNNRNNTEIIEQPLGNELIKALYSKDDEEAIALLKKWLQLHPTSLDATLIYSSLLTKKGRYAEAEVVLKNTPVQWHTNTAYIMEKALTMFGLNKDGQAIHLLSPLLKGDEDLERYKYLSNALLDMRKFTASDGYFQRAIAINANGYEYLRRASKLASMGENDRAFQSLNNAVAFDYITRNDLENSTGLHSLKGDARWKALIEKLK